MNVKFKRICSAMMAVVMLLSITVFPAYADTLSETITLSFGDIALLTDNGYEEIEVPIKAAVDGGSTSFDLASAQIYVNFPTSELEYEEGVCSVPDRSAGRSGTVAMNVGQLEGDVLTNANATGCTFIYFSDPANLNHTAQNDSVIATLYFKVKDSAPKSSSSSVSFATGEDTSSYVQKAYPASEQRAADNYKLAYGSAASLGFEGGSSTTVTVTYKANGGTGDDVTENVNAGASVTLKPANTFTAPTGKEFDAWEVDGAKKNPSESITVSANTEIKALWKDTAPETVTVTYKANGGTGTDVTETVNKGASVTLKPANTFTAPTGKEFDAWEVDGAKKNPGESVTVSANTEIKALWKDTDSSQTTTVTVTYKANGGTGDDITETVNAGASVTLKPASTFTAPANKQFKAWDVNGTEYQPDAQIDIAADTTVKAVWQDIPSYTVKFDANGGTGSMDNVNVQQGQKLTLPTSTFTAPANKQFQAWDVNGTEYQPDAQIDIAADTTVKAVWQDIPSYTVKFDANGGTGSMDNVNVQQGQKLTLPTSTFTAPANKQFKAWDVNGTEYQPDAQIDITADTTVKAVWQDIPSYTVQVDANGGLGSMDPVKVQQGQKFTLPTCPFTAPDGKQFKAWNVNGTEYQPNAQIEITADTTVKAVWQDIPSYTVKFDANGGTGSMDNVNVQQGQKLTLPTSTFTAPANKQFQAWDVNGTEYQPNAQVDITADTTVKVIWGQVVSTYTVKFDANGGTGSMDDVKIQQDQKLTLPANGFTAPSEKKFKAWNINGTEYQPDAQIDITADTTIQAVWQNLPTYTVKFDANGGTGSMDDITVREGEKLTLPDSGFTALSGQQFKVWNVNGTEYSRGAQVEITADTTIKAVWQDLPEQGCYVATAVYGSYDCPQVWTLRRFRDNVLAETWYGRLFIKAYYAVSPTCVKLFGDSEIFQNFFRGILDPWVASLQESGFESTPYNDIDW